MLHHLKVKLSLFAILIPSIAFTAEEIFISKAYIKKPRPGLDVTAGFATIKTDINLKVISIKNEKV